MTDITKRELRVYGRNASAVAVTVPAVTDGLDEVFNAVQVGPDWYVNVPAEYAGTVARIGYYGNETDYTEVTLPTEDVGTLDATPGDDSSGDDEQEGS